MNSPRRITLTGWDIEFCYNFQLGGEVALEIRGATKNGKGQENLIKVYLDESTLAFFARDLRGKLLQLQADRADQSRRNLDVFKAVTP